MTEFDVTYTKEYDVSSSFIEGAFFNENDNTVVLDVEDTYYRYSGVTAADVAELINADSVGAYYNTYFKSKFGPAEKLGYWADAEYYVVPVTKTSPGTPKGLSYEGAYATSGTAPHLTVAADNSGPTKEFSLNVFDQTVSGAPIATNDEDEPTKEFGLRLVEDVPEPPAIPTFTVHYRIETPSGNKSEKLKVTIEDAVSVQGAVDVFFERLGKYRDWGKVKKVVAKFK